MTSLPAKFGVFPPLRGVTTVLNQCPKYLTSSRGVVELPSGLGLVGYTFRVNTISKEHEQFVLRSTHR